MSTPSTEIRPGGGFGMGPRDPKLVPYAAQRVAYWYFVSALALFTLQLIVGLWLAISYAFTIPQSVVHVLPFGMTRAMHTNLLVLWMLLGFMGGTYYLVPEEAEREIYSVKLAYIQSVSYTHLRAHETRHDL